MPVLENRIKNSISAYLKQPQFSSSDKRWHIIYADLNTGAEYDIRFFTKEEANKYYFERYRYLQQFIVNLISKYNIKEK